MISCASSAGGRGVGSRRSRTTSRTRSSRAASARTTGRGPASSPKPTPANTTSSRRSRAVENLDTLVSTDWLAGHLDDPDLRVVDIRGYVKKRDLGGGRQEAEYLGAREEYDEAHVPGAVYVDWTRDITDPEVPVPVQIAPPRRFAELMSSLGIGDDTHVVVYDHAGGQFATRLWWALTYYGHDRVSVLDGGWRKWTAEGRPTTSAVPGTVPAAFTPRPRPGWRKVAEEVLAASERGETGAPGASPGPRTSTRTASSTRRAGPFARTKS